MFLNILFAVIFDGETIEGVRLLIVLKFITFLSSSYYFYQVPPLWVSAAAGHLNIVSLLVSNGANVNSTYENVFFYLITNAIFKSLLFFAQD